MGVQLKNINNESINPKTTFSDVVKSNSDNTTLNSTINSLTTEVNNKRGKNESIPSNLIINATTGSSNIQVTDVGRVDYLSGNRFALGNPDGIITEYSRDGGSTWVPFNTSENGKNINVGILTLPYSNFTLKLGNSETGNNNYKLKVTINAFRLGVYGTIDKILVYVSTRGTSKMYAQYKSKNSQTGIWSSPLTQQLTGWPGWNTLALNTAIGGVVDQNCIEIIFSQEINPNNTTHYTASVLGIVGVGNEIYKANSSLAMWGHNYEIDVLSNTVFPSNLYFKKNKSDSSYINLANALESRPTYEEMEEANTQTIIDILTDNTEESNNFTIDSKYLGFNIGDYFPKIGGTLEGNITINAKSGIYHNTNGVLKAYIGHDADNAFSHFYNAGGSNSIRLLDNGNINLNGGNVGIGDDSPSEKLTVIGNIKAVGNSTALTIVNNKRADIGVDYKYGTNRKAWVGYDSNGTRMVNFSSSSSIGITDQGTPYYLNNNVSNTLIHSGNIANQTVAKLSTKRVLKDANTAPTIRSSIIEEFSNNSANLPNNEYNYIFSTQGEDANYAAQLALGMTGESLYYRNKISSNWNNWKEVAFTGSNVASATTATNVNGTLVSVTFPTFSQLGVNVGETTTYLQALLRWCAGNYVNRGNVTLIGSAKSGSQGTCIIDLYSSSGKDSNGNPRYSSGYYQDLNSTNPVVFGTSNYTWYSSSLANTTSTYTKQEVNNLINASHPESAVKIIVDNGYGSNTLSIDEVFDQIAQIPIEERCYGYEVKYQGVDGEWRKLIQKVSTDLNNSHIWVEGFELPYLEEDKKYSEIIKILTEVTALGNGNDIYNIFHNRFLPENDLEGVTPREDSWYAYTDVGESELAFLVRADLNLQSDFDHGVTVIFSKWDSNSEFYKAIRIVYIRPKDALGFYLPVPKGTTRIYISSTTPLMGPPIFESYGNY